MNVNGNSILDATFEDHGSVWLVRPLTKKASEWLDENVDDATAQWFGGTLVVEPRFVQGLAEGMQLDGLEISR